MRVYILGPRIYDVRVTGTADQVAAAEAETILVSFRRPGDVAAKPPEPRDVAGKDPKLVSGGKEPFILGSIEHDPKFKTVGPEGAILVGRGGPVREVRWDRDRAGRPADLPRRRQGGVRASSSAPT